MYNDTEQKIIQALQNYQRYKKNNYLANLIKAQAQYQKARAGKHKNEINYFLNIYCCAFDVNKQEFLNAIANI